MAASLNEIENKLRAISGNGTTANIDIVLGINCPGPKMKKISKIPFRQSCIVEALFRAYPRGIAVDEVEKLVRKTQGSKQFENNIKLLQKKNMIRLQLENGQKYLYIDGEIYIKLQNYKSKQERLEKEFHSKNEGELKFLIHRKNDINGNEIIDKENVPPVHRWYGYLEGFPSELVRTKIKEYDLNSNDILIDPFCGSGTSLVEASFLGIRSVGIDANPAIIQVSKIKTGINVEPRIFAEVVKTLIGNVKFNINYKGENRRTLPLWNMPTIERLSWFDTQTLIKAEFIWEEINQIKDENIKELMKLALITTLRDCSNVQFAPGTSFYPYTEKPPLLRTFWNKSEEIYADLNHISNIKMAKADLILDDSRFLNKLDSSYIFDFLISSPPYPNDLEYTAQTRLELYLTETVTNMAGVRAIKENMVVGSTKQIWKHSNNGQFIRKFDRIQMITGSMAERLADKNWGFDYPKMVEEYFGDMYLHLKNIKKFMKCGSPLLYVVGDQSIKGVLIPVADILVEMAQDLGYSLDKIDLYRVRRSTGQVKSLEEKIVHLRA